MYCDFYILWQNIANFKPQLHCLINGSKVNQTIENNLVAEKILVLYFWPSDDILREFLSHIKVNTFIFCLGFNYIPKKHEFQWIKIKIESDLKTSVLKLTRSLRL